MNSLRQAKNYRLTRWRENEGGRAEKNMRMIVEACQDQQQFLSILVTQNSTEWMRYHIFHKNNAVKLQTKDWDLEQRTRVSNFGEKRVGKSRWNEIIRASGDINSTISIQDQNW